MKHTLIILAVFAAALTALHAAEPPVKLTDSGTVIKLGVSYNNVADELLNKVITTAEFAAALRDWQQRKITEAAAAAAEATRLKDLLAARHAQEEKENQRLKLDGPVAKALADLLAEAAKPEVQLEVERLEAEREAIAAKLKAARAKLK